MQTSRFASLLAPLLLKKCLLLWTDLSLQNKFCNLNLLAYAPDIYKFDYAVASSLPSHF